MARRQQMPSWLEQLYVEFTKPPHFLQKAQLAKAVQPNPSAVQPVSPSMKTQPSNAATTQQNKTQKQPTKSSAGNGRVNQQQTATATAKTMYANVPLQVLKKYPFVVKTRDQFPSITRIQTEDKKKYAIKETDLSVDHVRFIHRALLYARKQGFTRFSRFALTSKKSPAVQYEGRVYYATHWIDGQPANFASTEHVAQTAYALAQFHEATRNYSPEKYRPDDAFDLFGLTQQRNHDLRQMLTRAEAKDNRDEFDNLFISMKPQLLDDAAESLQLLQQQECVEFLKSDKKQAGLCHLDVIPGNCLYAPDHTVYLLDFDLSTFAPRALDIGHLLRRSLQQTNWDGDMAYACFLHFNAVKAMPKVEYKLVQSLLLFPYRVWRLAHTRYHYFSASTQTEELKTCAEQEPRRQHFLKSLASQIDGLSLSTTSEEE